MDTKKVEMEAEEYQMNGYSKIALAEIYPFLNIFERLPNLHFYLFCHVQLYVFLYP